MSDFERYRKLFGNIDKRAAEKREEERVRERQIREEEAEKRAKEALKKPRSEALINRIIEESVVPAFRLANSEFLSGRGEVHRDKITYEPSKHYSDPGGENLSSKAYSYTSPEFYKGGVRLDSKRGSNLVLIFAMSFYPTKDHASLSLECTAYSDFKREFGTRAQPWWHDLETKELMLQEIHQDLPEILEGESARMVYEGICILKGIRPERG